MACDKYKYISALSDELNMIGSNIEERITRHHKELENFRVEKMAIQ